MYLLINESPAKAKKIQGFLNENYKVVSSCGHIRDLEKKKTKVYGDPSSFGIGIVHLGVGSFHKAHQAYYTDKDLEKSCGVW